MLSNIVSLSLSLHFVKVKKRKKKKKKENVSDKPAQTKSHPKLPNGRYVEGWKPNKITIVVHPISLFLPLEKTNPNFGMGWLVCLKTSRFFISFPIPKHILHFGNVHFTPVSITFTYKNTKPQRRKKRIAPLPVLLLNMSCTHNIPPHFCTRNMVYTVIFLAGVCGAMYKSYSI